MSMGGSLYPISEALNKLILNSGYSPLGLTLAMGGLAETLLPDLTSWLESGEGDEYTIAEITAAHPEEAEQLWNAVAETKAMRAAAVDPVELEKAQIRARFEPYIYAEGTEHVPTQITIFCRYRRP